MAAQERLIAQSNLKSSWEGVSGLLVSFRGEIPEERALALGGSLSMIGKLLGHNKIDTTARYAHLARDSVKASSARVADSIAADILDRDATAARRCGRARHRRRRQGEVPGLSPGFRQLQHQDRQRGLWWREPDRTLDARL